jgi:hypothetical protein
MSEEKVKNDPSQPQPPPQQPQQPEPDPTVKHRKVVYVLDHVLPEGDPLVEESEGEK